ncbi:neutral zinc metallopeptidase [Amycolatopsis sp. H20-H5]|uniref:neutral zinc metallopeptidase n=1 Tax=Amycolatopsis sp. H20-H5 TaxID=3046309 RepID=UPI002DB7F9B4|nr:neutral zinc metallopeptidase [Amycolatopsis sp. H20-H5]MEC3978807.1 neutral zinc metallopeptidase [Amycolatopsis sp. H20-H5]
MSPAAAGVPDAAAEGRAAAPARRRPPPRFVPGYAGPPPGAPFSPRFAPGYGYSPYPVKKSNTGAIVLVAMIGVFALLGGVIAVFALANDNTRHVADAGYSSTYPTTSYSSTYTTGTSYSPVTSVPSTSYGTSTARSTGSSRTSARDSPTSTTPQGPHKVVKLADNPLFADADFGLQNVPCSLSRWATDKASVTRFFQTGIVCLDAMWSKALAGADLPSATPNLSVPNSISGSSATPCGSAGATPFYCPTNNTIYLPMDRIEIETWGNHPGPYLSILAHEYGHHVQEMSGIFDAYGNARYDAGADSAAGLETSRRLELEAQCFSGMFLGSASVSGGSVDKNIYNEGWNSQNRGDEYNPAHIRDHGTAKHNIAWWQHGATTNRTPQCSTWNSSSGDIS